MAGNKTSDPSVSTKHTFEYCWKTEKKGQRIYCNVFPGTEISGRTSLMKAGEDWWIRYTYQLRSTGSAFHIIFRSLIESSVQALGISHVA